MITQIGAIHYGTGLLGSAAVGLLADGSLRPLGIVVALGGVGSLLSLKMLGRSGNPT